jgi:hypothetical protein
MFLYPGDEDIIRRPIHSMHLLLFLSDAETTMDELPGTSAANKQKKSSEGRMNRQDSKNKQVTCHVNLASCNF